MAQRFELEVVTIFSEQGLDAAVNHMQQKLRSIAAPPVAGGAAATAPIAGGNAASRDPANQIAAFNKERLALQQVMNQAVSAGSVTTQAAAQASRTLTNEVNSLTKLDANFRQALSQSQQRGATLLGSKPQVDAELRRNPPPPPPPPRPPLVLPRPASLAQIPYYGAVGGFGGSGGAGPGGGGFGGGGGRGGSGGSGPDDDYLNRPKDRGTERGDRDSGTDRDQRATDKRAEAMGIRADTKHDDLMLATQEVINARRVQAGRLAAMAAVDSDYITATASLASARDAIAAAALRERRGDPDQMVSAANRKSEQTLFNAQRDIGSNGVLLDPANTQILAGQKESQVRLNAAIMRAANEEGDLAEAAAQLATARATQRADSAEILAADEAYQDATRRLAITRAEVAALESTGLRANAVPALANAQGQKRLLNADVGTAANNAISANPNDVASITNLQTSQARLALETARLAVEEGDLAEVMARSATVRARLNGDVAEIRAADEAYIAATIRSAAARDRQAALTSAGTRSNEAAIRAAIEAQYQRTLTTVTRDTAVNAQILANDQALAALGERKIAADQRNLAVRDQANAIAVRNNAGSQVLGGGSLFQRAQASLAARQGGGTVDPNRFQTGGQFVASRAFTTAGFALSGAALYGGVNALQSMVEQTEKLDAQFTLLQQQFDATGQSADFSQFRQAMLDIAQTTGQTGSDVANIGFQLKGAFNDTEEAIAATSAAMKLVAISGLGIDEVTNDMTATAATYGVTFEQIGDAVTSIERRYGVLTAQSLNTFGQMSNTAHQAGLSFEQFGEIVGAVGRVSGRSSSAIAESFNRILPSIQSNASQIQAIYAQASDAGQFGTGPDAQQRLNQITESLAQGQSGEALIQILEDYDRFSQAQQNRLQFTLGGARESQTIAPLVQQRNQILEGSRRGPSADAGGLQQRFDVLAETLQTRLDRVAEKFRQLGVQLGNAGLLDALKLLAGGMIILLDATNRILSVFNGIDDLFGGIPSKIVAIAVAIKLLQIAFGGLRQLSGPVQSIFRGDGFGRGASRAADAAGDVAQTAGQRRIAAAAPVVPRPSVAAQGTLYNEAAVQRTIRDRLSTSIAAGVQGVRTGAVTDRVRNAYAATGDTARQPALPGFGAFATTAQTMNTTVTTAGRGFAASVGTGLRNLGSRLQAQLIALGNLNARTFLPGPGGAAGQAGGRVSTFLTGGGGLQGGVMTAAAGVAAFSSVTELFKSITDQRKGLAQQQTGLRQQAGTKSLAQLQELDRGGLFNDGNFSASTISANLGLSQSLRSLGDEAIGRATEREFEQAINSGLLARSEERDKLLKQVKDSQGMGEAGEAARAALNAIPAEDRQRIADLGQSVGKAKQEAETHGDTNLIAIQTLQQQYELGSASYTEYVDGLTMNVERLRQLAANGSDAVAIKNYQTALSELTQVRSSAAQQQDQVFAQILEAQGLVPEARSRVLQQRLAPGIPASARRAAANLSAPTEGAVSTPVIDAVTDPAARTQRYAQVNQLVQTNRQLFAEAAQNVNDPALLEQLRQAFSLSPEQLAEFQALQSQLGIALGDTGEITILAAQLRQSRDNAFQLAQTNAQTAIAGMYDPAAIARINQGLAQRQRTDALQITDQGERERAVATANQAIAQANRQGSDVADQTAMARLQAQGARVAQNPVAAAQNAVAQANLAIQQARGNQAAMYAAQGQLASAQQQLRDANSGIAQAQIDLFKAQNPDDAIAQAQAAQRSADLAARTAVGEKARLDAMALRLQADRQMEDAINGIADAQSGLIEAQANAAGDLVGAAQQGLNRAQTALDRARARRADAGVIAGLEADLVNQANSLREQQNSDMREMIDFNLAMGTIGASAAAEQYRAMLPLLNPREQREMLLAIRRLEEQASGSADGLQFNLPTTLGLPTLYTARRMTQETGQDGRLYASGGDGGGVANYDNRVVSITLNTDAGFDGQAAVQTIVNALNEAPRFGSQPRLY